MRSFFSTRLALAFLSATVLPPSLSAASRSALDSLNALIGVDAFHRAGFKGKGIIIGTAEYIDYSLWDFRNPDGTTRFLRYYDKSREYLDSMLRAHYPENRYYPVIPCCEDTLRIRSEFNFHGTAVLGIAAGNAQSKGVLDWSGKYLGVAPEADLAVGEYRDLKAMADSLGRPLVFNHSFKAPMFLAPGDLAPGRIAVIAAGNSHSWAARHRFAPGDTQGFTVHIRPHSEEFHRVSPSYFQIDLVLRLQYPDSAADSVLVLTLESPNDTVLRYELNMNRRPEIQDWVRGIYPRDDYKGCREDSASAYELVLFSESNLSVFWNGGAYHLQYMLRSHAIRGFNLSFNRKTFRGAEELVLPLEMNPGYCQRPPQAAEIQDILKGTMDIFNNPDRAAPIPDLAAIHVGAYVRRPRTLDSPVHQVGDIAYYSSRGDFARSGVVKPEIAVPAHGLITVAPFEPRPEDPPGDSLHVAFGGTSAAAPVVTGVVALLLQMDPTLDTRRIKEILRENAHGDAFTGALPNDTWGYGKLGLDFEKIRNKLGVSILPRVDGNFRVRRVFPHPFHERVRIEYFLPEADPTAFLEIRDMRGRLMHRHAPGAAKGLQVREVEAAGWPGGIYTYRLSARRGQSAGKLVRAD